MNAKTGKKQLCKCDILWLILLASIAVFLFWRCKFGFAYMDEAFYLTIPYRLVQGDNFFVHEWHLSQMSAFLLIPFVGIFKAIHGNLDGIILSARYYYVFITILSAVFIYYELGKINKPGALISSLMFSIYAPFGIMALSYNSMGLITLTISCTLFMTSSRKKPLQFFISGIFMAFSILCCPYLLILYIIYTAYVFIYNIMKKKRDCISIKDTADFKSYMIFSAGAIAVAFLFFFFIFSRESFSDFFQGLQACMLDPEHPKISLIDKAVWFMRSIVLLTEYSFPIYLFTAVLFIICICDKKRNDHKIIYFCTIMVVSLMLLVNIYTECHYINHLMWPLNIIAPFALILLNNEQARKLFTYIWIPGMIYAFCINLSSNQGFYVISSASTVSCMASIMLTSLLISDIVKSQQQRIISRVIPAVILSVLLLTQFYSLVSLRYNAVFWDNPIKYQTDYIEEGTHKGLYVSPNAKQQYIQTLNADKIIRTYNPKKVLIFSPFTWMYLFDNYEFATYSAWLSGVNSSTIDRLSLYYELNPDKYPDLVYADKINEPFAEAFCDIFGYKIDYNEDFLILVDK